MSQAPAHDRDPLKQSLAIAGVFALLGAIRLTALPQPYFDEVHYLPAARELLNGGQYLNREHPLLGKTIMAAGIWLLGDDPIGWRTFPLVAGTVALIASIRAMWHATSFKLFCVVIWCAFGERVYAAHPITRRHARYLYGLLSFAGGMAIRRSAAQTRTR